MALRPQDILMGLAVPLIWGLGVVFAKAAIGHFPPVLLMALRFTLTALILVWFVKPPWRLMGQLFVIALISAAVQYSLTFNGLRGVDASTAVLVLQLEVPFLILLGAVLLKEKPGWRRWLGIAIAFIGVAFIAGEPRLGAAWDSLALLFGGAFTWALGQIMVRRLGEVGGFTTIAWVAVFAAPQLFVFSLVLEDDHLAYLGAAGWVVWGTVLYMGIVMTALGYGLWYSLVGRFPLARVGPFLLLMPVFSVLGGVTLLGESLTLRVAIGGAIVIAGVAVILVRRASAAELGPAPEAGARRFDRER
ncbi:MAG: EamA family transporter [Proteobacteria bacterium]|nr:EamA family transporter [Pseudomonadota bacterium]